MVSILDQLHKDFQDRNPERFNEDVIYMRRNEQSKTKEFLEQIFRSLKIPGITFEGMRLITDELAQRDYVPVGLRPIEESILDLVVATFTLEADGDKGLESKTIDFHLYFPRLVDDFFFKLGGNRYFALYQISDKSFYATSKGIYLKTLLMPLSIKIQAANFVSMSGEKIEGMEYRLDPFNTSKNVDVKNMFLYYFIEYGEAAVPLLFEKFGEDKLFLHETENGDYEEFDGYDAFQVKKGSYIYYDKELLEDDKNFRNMVITLTKSLKGVRKSLSELFTDTQYLKKRILNSAAANTNKADKAILSLKRVLDEVTASKLEATLGKEFTSDTFAIAKYMVWNFEDIYNIDTVDLHNRRLRLFEYMVYPLLTKLSDATYRIFNSRNITLKRLNNVFSAIRPDFIIKNLVNNDLLRYYNATSTLEIFTVALRFSARGPQALGGAGGGVTLKYRGIHPSYVGVVGMSMASASDPGMTGTLCPLTRKIDKFEFKLD